MRIRTLTDIGDIKAQEWNGLSIDGNPFLRHEFLYAMEQQSCVGPRVGWFPNHLWCEDDEGRVLGALPMYLKANSFGEFVFDWSWAGAHERLGLPYYPKAVVAAPFTPAMGPRLLIGAQVQREVVAPLLIDGAIEAVDQAGLSSLHWLFSNDEELAQSEKLLARKGCQFHWENRQYRDFTDFLDTLSAKRRKEIKRERRLVADRGIEIVRRQGDQMRHADWELFHGLYRRTFAKHGNYAALSAGFFRQLGRTMGHQVLVFFARERGQDIAAALFFRGVDALYGRYWGSMKEVPGLHFEVCYYQGIEYCIENAILRFEPGAQGEHKVSRGFDPRATWSYHWISQPELRNAIARFLSREAEDVDAYMRALLTHSAYRDPYPC